MSNVSIRRIIENWNIHGPTTGIIAINAEINTKITNNMPTMTKSIKPTEYIT